MTLSSAKAIETVYNGYRFRSRLESRWAVFFDSIGIHYEYEPEGFDLAEAGWYLPDFRLPDLNIWFEVKPGRPSPQDSKKLATFAYRNSCDVICAMSSDFAIPSSGPADAMDYPAFSGMWLRSFPSEVYDEEGDFGYSWAECAGCHYIGIHPSRSWANDQSTDHGFQDGKWFRRHVIRLEAAYKAARQARFEYGETQKVPLLEVKNGQVFARCPAPRRPIGVPLGTVTRNLFDIELR